MTEETTKTSTGSRSKAGSIHSILSSSDHTTNNTLSSQRSKSQLFEIGQESQPQVPVVSLTGPGRPTRRLPEQERKKQRHHSAHSTLSDPAYDQEREFHDNLKRRKLSVVPHPFTLGSAEDTSSDHLGLSTEDDAPLRSFPAREYPRRLSIASVLTADSSSLPSVISPATSTSWTGLASSTSSTSTANPPQWPLLSELYYPGSHKSPIASTASTTTALGSHSRSYSKLGADDPDFNAWELEIEATSNRLRTPISRNAPRRTQSEALPFHSTVSRRLAMSQGGSSREDLTGNSPSSRMTMLSSTDDAIGTFGGGIGGGTANPELQPSVEAYNDLVEDLQHKLSTKTLALETLQKEHDRLLGAYSRQQTRSAAIQKKCTVADSEIVTLSAERDRLQDALDISENQVQDLIEQRDAVNKRLVARVKEYSNIVQLASQMENLSTLEVKRWRERDATLRSRILERDKAIEEMQQRLTVAESSENTRRSTPISGDGADAEDPTAVIRENEALKARVRELEESLAERKQEVSRMEEIGRMLLTRSREGSDPTAFSSQSENPS